MWQIPYAFSVTGFESAAALVNAPPVTTQPVPDQLPAPEKFLSAKRVTNSALSVALEDCTGNVIVLKVTSEVEVNPGTSF
jgi:hypothetical protein